MQSPVEGKEVAQFGLTSLICLRQTIMPLKIAYVPTFALIDVKCVEIVKEKALFICCCNKNYTTYNTAILMVLIQSVLSSTGHIVA